ncbi:GOLPH3/VPS74 family protein [Streptomyces telluris]|uniref:GPP34 family phosphoprotein n=1 Tax=Streptomyces telluris TaxID=2720021 RepID=A0A9X2LNW1_9ACTN|nr:GPP34 family phosphoprotein [Streptomyces telluris]MCQ8774429.1 GPP34 family phosphoprotein [Streptomyces telluris]NJP80978.1 GPP34 family phosphoprotein [Streptomyces telluris]
MTPDAPRPTLAEELLLLCFDPDSGRKLMRAGHSSAYGVAGAALAELRLAGRVVEEHGRVRVTNPLPPPDDPLLAAALESLAQPGKDAKRGGPRTARWVRSASGRLEEAWLARLAESGAVRVETRRFLGLFPYRHASVGPVDLTTAARRRFELARRGGFADPRARALAALASAIGISGSLCPGWGRRPERQAMRRLVRTDWAARAVHKNVMSDNADGGGGAADGGGGGDGGG